MSYIPIDVNNMNEGKDMIQNTQETKEKKPNFARHTQPHTPEVKKRIAATQRARYKMLEALVKKAKQKQLTEERVRDICSEVLNKYLYTYILNKNNKQSTEINP